MINTVSEQEASILNACPDVDTSMFKRSLDRRIYAIKDIREKESVLGQHFFAIILVDKYGKRNGKFVAMSCPPDFL